MNIPLLRPALPSAELLLPYLRQIDQNGHYTNFGPLEKLLLQQLLKIQSKLDGASVWGLLVSSATQGLELAINQLGLPFGSKIAVPALTFVATATAIQRCGHVPVVLDVDKHSWLLTPSQIPRDLSRTGIAAIIPVATFGMPQNADEWSHWSLATGVPVIIDAAASFGGQKTADGVTVVFSLHATKILSTAEGGLIVSRNQALAEKMRSMTNFGIGLNGANLGTNAKMSEYHAAIGLAHLEVWPLQIQTRKKLLKFYLSTLTNAFGGRFKIQTDTGLCAPSIFNIQVDSGQTRERMEAVCAANSIQTRRWYQPLVQHQPMLGSLASLGSTPNADELSQSLMGLPFFIDMTQEQVVKVCEVLKSQLS